MLAAPVLSDSSCLSDHMYNFFSKSEFGVVKVSALLLRGVYSGLNNFLCVSRIWRIQFKGLLKIRIGLGGGEVLRCRLHSEVEGVLNNPTLS